MRSPTCRGSEISGRLETTAAALVMPSGASNWRSRRASPRTTRTAGKCLCRMRNSRSSRSTTTNRSGAIPDSNNARVTLPVPPPSSITGSVPMATTWRAMARPNCRLDGATAPIRAGDLSQRKKNSAVSLSSWSSRTRHLRAAGRSSELTTRSRRSLSIWFMATDRAISSVGGTGGGTCCERPSTPQITGFHRYFPIWVRRAAKICSTVSGLPLGADPRETPSCWCRPSGPCGLGRNAMPLRAEEQKRERIDGVLSRAGQRIPVERAEPIRRFIKQFYDHVPPEDVLQRGTDDLYGAALSLWHFAQERKPRTPKLRAFNPRAEEEGWRVGRTVVEIVNDDMPFLVDSVTAALNGLDLAVHLVIHPILHVRRDPKGKLIELVPL